MMYYKGECTEDSRLYTCVVIFETDPCKIGKQTGYFYWPTLRDSATRFSGVSEDRDSKVIIRLSERELVRGSGIQLNTTYELSLDNGVLTGEWKGTTGGTIHCCACDIAHSGVPTPIERAAPTEKAESPRTSNWTIIIVAFLVCFVLAYFFSGHVRSYFTSRPGLSSLPSDKRSECERNIRSLVRSVKSVFAELPDNPSVDQLAHFTERLNSTSAIGCPDDVRQTYEELRLACCDVAAMAVRDRSITIQAIDFAQGFMRGFNLDFEGASTDADHKTQSRRSIVERYQRAQADFSVVANRYVDF